MSLITRTYTFTDGTTAYGSQVESEISNIATILNNIDASTQALATLKISGVTTFGAGTVTAPGLIFGGSTGTGFYQSGANTWIFSSSGVKSSQLTDNGILCVTSGGAGNPAYSFITDSNTGWMNPGADSMGLSLGGSEKFEWTATYYTPQVNNAVSLGASGFRWTEVFATNGTINTSHSSTKQDIVAIDVANVKLPPGVYYRRDGRRRIGYLNDDLPDEARPMDEKGNPSKTDNYESAVIGILCAKVRRLEEKLGL